MKFAWSSILCLLVIQAAAGLKDLFKHLSHDEDKPSILDIFTKPKIPGINVQLGGYHFGTGGFHGSHGSDGSHGSHGSQGYHGSDGSHGSHGSQGYHGSDGSHGSQGYHGSHGSQGYHGSHGSHGLHGSKSFGFGFSFGGQFQGGHGINLPPKDIVNVKPIYPGEDKKKAGPRPNWEGEKGGYPKPGSYDDEKDYSKPGSYDDEKDYSKPGPYEDDRDRFPKPGEFPKYEEKESLPDWEDIGEKHPKSESLMEGDMVGDGLIQPRLNRRRSKRFIESKIYHVPLLFRSNAKPYGVKIRSNPNSLTKGN